MTSDDCRFSCTEANLTPAGASRRVFLLGAAGVSLAAGSLTARRAPAAEKGESVALFAYIGCLTSAQRRARAPQAAVGRAISVYRIDTNGTWSRRRGIRRSFAELPSPGPAAARTWDTGNDNCYDFWFRGITE